MIRGLLICIIMEEQKGCVYFFRHIGLTPVKIGYSSNKSPLKRFESFKTYAPFGAEIIGFIQTDESKQIETTLHQKYASRRIEGEWFEITEKDCLREIDFYSKKEDIKARNDFQIEWAKKLQDKKEQVEKETKTIRVIAENKKKHLIIEAYMNNPMLNRTHLAKNLNVSRRYVIKTIKKFKTQKAAAS